MRWLALGIEAAFLLVAFGHPVLRHWGRARPTRADDTTPRSASWHVADTLFVLGWVVLAAGALLAPDAGLEGLRAALGVALVLAAVALIVWSQRTMGLAWRPDIPPVPDGTLATTGPFAAVRNPNYVAMLGAALGVVVVAWSLVAAAGWVVLLLSLALTARAEEPPLRARYGAAYDDYAARVGRFVPGIGRLHGRAHR